MELADIVLVNKADGELKDAELALTTLELSDYLENGLRTTRFPKAMTVSAIEKDGISETWKVISNLVDGVRKKVIFSLIVRNSQSFGQRMLDISYCLFWIKILSKRIS